MIGFFVDRKRKNIMPEEQFKQRWLYTPFNAQLIDKTVSFYPKPKVDSGTGLGRSCLQRNRLTDSFFF